MSPRKKLEKHLYFNIRGLFTDVSRKRDRLTTNNNNNNNDDDLYNYNNNYNGNNNNVVARLDTVRVPRKKSEPAMSRPRNLCNIRARSTSLFIVGFLTGCFLWQVIQTSVDNQFKSCQHIREYSPRLKAPWSHLWASRTAAEDAKSPDKTAGLYGDDDDHYLFIGIMTARKYLDSRAKASNMTWAHRIPGQVVYFLGEGEPYHGDMNVVMLKGVTENDYPPQKKSFAMVEYMAKHYAPYYKWLIRADDDVYMRADELVRFLKSVDNRGLKYIGQPGFGKVVEKGKLGLSGAFCMGGPGVIMSSELVTAVAPALKDCLKLTVTGHEDTELGRCITLTTDTTCTSNYEMKELMYQNYEELHLPNSSFKKSLGKDELRAITLHPFKDMPYVFRMDNFFNTHKLAGLTRRSKTLATTRDVLNSILDSAKRKNYTEGLDKVLLGSTPQIPPPSPEELDDEATRPQVNLDNIRLLPKNDRLPVPAQSWEYVRYKRIFSTTLETGKIELPLIYRRRTELHDDMVSTLQSKARITLKTAKPNPLQFVNETYQRLSAVRGVEGILFIKSWLDKKKVIQPVYLHHPFQEFVDFREADVQDEFTEGRGKTIYMLMPLYQRSAIYRRFLNMYAQTVQEYRGKVELRVVVFVDERGEHRLISAATSAILERSSHVDIRLTYMEEGFNRGRGIMAALSDIPYSSLLLFMDVDMEFNANFLQRVSDNTIEGRNTFFPVYFVHYNPESICYQRKNCDIYLDSRRDEVGLWRSFSYGIGSVYKSDLVKAGGFKTDIVGWGLEDVDFFEKCQAIGLPVMRGGDTSLIHRYHPRECNTSLPATQLQQCYDSGNAMLGSVKSLWQMLWDVSDGQGV